MGSSGAAPVGAAREGVGEEVSGPGAAAACPHQPPALHGGAAARFASPGRRPLPPLVARRRREGRRKTPERLPGEPAPLCLGRRGRRRHVGSECRAAIMG